MQNIPVRVARLRALRPVEARRWGPDRHDTGSGASPASLRRRLFGVLPLLLLVLVSLTTCGLPGDDSVDPVAVPPGPTTPERTGSAAGGREVSVWFVRGAHLEAVSRWTEIPGPAGAVELLQAGPTRAEVVDGLRTALSPVDLAVLPNLRGAGTVTIAVGRDFADIGGGNQLLAVAQVVWTATQFSSVDLVCFSLDGIPAEVPTDAGLTARPVSRSDYLSVAPRSTRGTSPPTQETPSTCPPFPSPSSPG